MHVFSQFYISKNKRMKIYKMCLNPSLVQNYSLGAPKTVDYTSVNLGPLEFKIYCTHFYFYLQLVLLLLLFVLNI